MPSKDKRIRVVHIAKNLPANGISNVILNYSHHMQIKHSVSC